MADEDLDRNRLNNWRTAQKLEGSPRRVGNRRVPEAGKELVGFLQIAVDWRVYEPDLGTPNLVGLGLAAVLFLAGRGARADQSDLKAKSASFKGCGRSSGHELPRFEHAW